MPRKLRHHRRPLCENLRLLVCLLSAPSRQQILRQLSVVELRKFTVRGEGKRFTQQLLRGFHLSQQLVAHRQEAEVMRTVPVVLCRNVLGTIVGTFQIVRFSKLFDGILNAPRPAKFMSAHVMCVRNRRGYAQICLAVVQRLIGAADVLVGMSQIMMRSGIVGRNCQRG